jgi:hypothetical protein
VYVARHSGSPDKLTSAPHAAVTMSLLVCASSSNSVSSHRVRIRYPVTPLNRVRLPRVISGNLTVTVFIIPGWPGIENRINLEIVSHLKHGRFLEQFLHLREINNLITVLIEVKTAFVSSK